MSEETPASPEPASAEPPGDPPTRRMMSPLSLLATVFFLAVWLGPITYVGSAGRDIGWMHRDLRHMQRVACLFTREVGAWGTYHIEIRTAPGAEWVELPLDGYFDMSIFGYRTRFHRLVGKSYRRGGGRARSQYLARWIADRYAERNPEAPPLAGVRFVSASRTVAELLREEGRFRKLPLAEMPARRRRVLITFEGHPLRYVPQQRGRWVLPKTRPKTGQTGPQKAPQKAPPKPRSRPLRPLPRPGGAP